MKKVLYFFLGVIGLLSLIASVAATQVTHEALMHEGFLQFAQTGHLDVPASRYGAYAHAIVRYLDDKTDEITVPDAQDASKTVQAFSDKENTHMQDVRQIVRALKWARWIGGGGTVLVTGLLYFLKRSERALFLRRLVRGFAAAAMALLFLAACLGVWGAVNFQGLFWAFHQAVFSNDLWLLNPQTDLLMALMPLPFFTWYALQILKALLPILGLMLLLIFAYYRTKERA